MRLAACPASTRPASDPSGLSETPAQGEWCRFGRSVAKLVDEVFSERQPYLRCPCDDWRLNLYPMGLAMMHRDNRDRKGKMRIVLQKFSPRRAIFLSAGAFISADYIWDVPWQCAKETHKTHACIFLFCHMMLNGIHSHCLFGFTHQFDMLLVEGYTNLEEVGDALLLHCRNIGAPDVWLPCRTPS